MYRGRRRRRPVGRRRRSVRRRKRRGTRIRRYGCDRGGIRM